MTTNEKVIIMSFSSESESYQAFSELKKLHQVGNIKGEQMAILEHRANHNLEPKDFIDFTGADKNFKGSMIGMLVGILGGPLGILLGWFTGSLIGSSKDVKEVKNAMSIFEQSLEIIPEGETGLILICDEPNTGHIDDIVLNQLHGRIERLTKQSVEEELYEAEQAQKEAEEQARKRWFRKK
ncbi:DUF1269 domain-containing protein [Vagococcus fluvialis]|uniref:DUF1269 domain-containing protein n=1 Tax=Vagococcus fluvialis TaxID=2738 RepID=UPI001A9013CA|nr:DUF1269 domain-containing protein [Vagococcus fluvialis]MBO0430223.1 DUF1269 domain-containing protein [Vagococcus fluvialis]